VQGALERGAQVSERHANVIINPGEATAEGVRSLVKQMVARVRERFGVELQLELKILDSNGKRRVRSGSRACMSRPRVVESRPPSRA